MSDLGLPDMSMFQTVAADAMKTLQAEREKLAEASRMWRETNTTVASNDNAVSVTLDARGELVSLAFNTKKYRTMPPVQLASLIVDTIQRGRAQSIEKVAESMPNSSIPGLDLDMTTLAKGEVDPQELLDKLFGPILGGLGGDTQNLPGNTPDGGSDKGHHNA